LGDKEQADALFWAAVKEYCLPSRPECNHAEPPDRSRREISFAKARYDFSRLFLPVEDFYPASDGMVLNQNPLRDKVVVLGRTDPVSDRHPTAWGDVNGVELVAAAIEAELNPPDERELGTIPTYALEVALAFAIFFIHYFCKPFAALFGTAILLSIVVFISAVVVFLLTPYQVEFVPFLVGIWIEQTYELATNAEEDLEKLEKSLKTEGPLET
jgi:hypothetical protein